MSVRVCFVRGLRRVVLCAVVLAAGMASPEAVAVSNPVLPGVADAGVLRFNGRYYLMGVGTSGGFHVSDDLVHWNGPGHAFSMDNRWATGAAASDANIHACDIALVNGQFNLYWSVNSGELREIGRAVASDILGPYAEPVREAPFDGRIDPNLFVDDDGALYLYTVKFALGNWIWGQRLSDPGTLRDTPQPLLSAVPGTWELQDEPVNEGPFVLRHRGRYYMLYNANHTALRYGNYALGCAVADGPLSFSNAGKYAHPVLDKVPAEANGGLSVRNCGQPTVVRGPNWFERWLVYFAVYGDNPLRAQGIDRVHFFDRELFVDGPTTPSTPGAHPDPALPAFRDLFDRSGALGAPWNVSGGEWAVQEGALRQTRGQGLCRATLDVPSANHYAFEAGLRFLDRDARQAGVIAWENGRESAIYAALDRRQNAWFWVRRDGFVIRTEVFPLPSGFDWDGWHQLAVIKNGGAIEVLLDGIPAPGNAVIPADGCGAGRPGLATRNGAAAYGGAVYSIGWEEAGASIRGWDGAVSGTAASGVWGAGKSGLLGEPVVGEARVFKGDLLRDNEFSVQVFSEQTDAAAQCGAYPVYADEDNFVRVSLDRGLTRVTVTGRRGGVPLQENAVPVAPRQRRAVSLEEGGCNLRMLRLGERLVVWVDGVEAAVVAGDWPAAQAGLFSVGGPCRFNGISRVGHGAPAAG